MDIFAGLDLASSLNSFKLSTQNAMQTVRDNTLTPVDITTVNMKQGVALKTARDTGVTGVITDYRSRSVDQLDGLIGALSGGLLNVKDITRAVKVGPGGVVFSSDDVLREAGNEIGYPVTGQSGAMRRLAGSINNEFSRIAGFDIGTIVTSDGNGFRINKNWRGQVGANVLRNVMQVSGIDEYIDTTLKAAVYNSILNGAVDYGMSDSYRKLYDAYPAGMEDYRRDAIIQAVDNAITNGDIVSLDALISLLEQDGKNTILAKYPNLIQTLFAKFKFDQSVFPEDYPTLRDKLLNLLVMLAGPQWYMKYTQFGYAYDLALINDASPDIITLLGSVDEVVPLLCSAGLFGARSAVDVMKGNFQDAPQFTF